MYTILAMLPLTDNQTLHFVFAEDIHFKSIANFIIELERATTRGHDAQLARLRAILFQLLVAQVPHKLDAVVYAVSFEDLKIEPAAGVRRVCFTGEVDELDE